MKLIFSGYLLAETSNTKDPVRNDLPLYFGGRGQLDVA